VSDLGTLSWYGVDPGPSSGCLCLLDEVGQATFHLAKNMTTTDLYNYLAGSYGLVGGVIEEVWVRPMQGISSQAKLILHRGQAEGVASSLELPWRLLKPQVWRKMLGLCPESDKTKRKKANRQLAQQLYPSTKLTNDKVDALLLAHLAKTLIEPKC
jgi:hypothetical protein